MTNLVVPSNRSFVVFIATLLWLTGCSKDPTSPPEEEIPEAYTLQSTDTIGAAGGAVEADGFSLTVPAGALASDTEIKLYASDSETPFGDNGVTKTFRLDGFPTAFSQPLRVAIKYEGTLTEESFVGFGSWANDVPSGDSAIVYDLEPATDSSGYLVSELPVPTAVAALRLSGPERLPKNVHDDRESLNVLGISGYKARPTAHFDIMYPGTLPEANIDSLAGILESSYLKVTDSTVLDGIGFSFEGKTWDWPINVVVADIQPAFGALGTFVYNMPVINVNQSMVSQSLLTMVRMDAGLEILFFAIETYDSDFYYPGHFWLNQAVFAWSEQSFTSFPLLYEYPEHFPGLEMAPFHGMRAGASNANGELAHGCGMSAMIQHLVDTSAFGKSGLINTYVDISNGTDPAAALLNNFDGLVAEWWPNFIRKYVSGAIYDVSSAVFTNIANLSGVWYLDGENDTLKLFAAADDLVGSYPDLSAKLFLIDLNYPEMDSSMQMVLKVSDNVGTEPVNLAVYGIQSGPLVYLGHTDAQSEYFQIPGVRMYMDEGWTKFLVVVINSDHNASTYTGQTEDIDLTIKVEPGEYNSCLVSYRMALNVHQEHNYGDGSSSYYDSISYKWEHPRFTMGYYVGSFSGTTFTGIYEHQWDSTGKVITWYGELTATHNPAGDLLTDLDFSWSVTTSENYPEDSYTFLGNTTWTLSGGNLTKVDDEPGVLTYRVEGAATCNSITYYDYAHNDEMHDHSYWETFDITRTGYECNPDSAVVEVRFLKR